MIIFLSLLSIVFSFDSYGQGTRQTTQQPGKYFFYRIINYLAIPTKTFEEVVLGFSLVDFKF